MGEIFISYSRNDGDFVDQLTGELEQSSFDVWVDRADIRGGAAWRAEIARAIRECDAFIVVLSRQSVSSNNVTKELALADQHNRRIIPILREPCDIPEEMDYPLAGLQMIDFAQQPFEAAFDQLARALRPGSEKRPQRRSQPQPAAGQPQQPVPTMPALPQLLLGTWQVQIVHAFTGMTAHLTIQMHPNGFFQGQLVGPSGMLAIDGQWKITPLNQLVMQGQQSNGFQVVPYATMVQFSQITTGTLSGTSGAGEQVTWQKVA